MKKELQDYLINKFPLIYQNCEKNHPFALFSFECNDGWFRIIYWLSAYIQNHIDRNNKWAAKYPDQYKPIEQVKAFQVKEKFRELRYYYNGGDDKINSVVSFVEFISGFICESTGKMEDVGYNSKGWIKTHHESLAEKKDFHFVDDEELRALISKNK